MNTPDLSLTIVRTLDAPPELVFEAWTTAEHARRWWYPRQNGQDFACVSFAMDFSVGGAYRYCIRSPEGQDTWAHGSFREIVANRRLVFTFQWEWTPEVSDETLITVSFEPHSKAGTRLTFTQAPFTSEELRDGHTAGWGAVLDRLEEDIAGAKAASAAKEGASSIRTFSGSCHCGAVRFRCDIDLAQPTSRCNCTMCTKTRLWKTMAQPGSFALLQGEDAVVAYRFAGQRIEHRFCARCGVKLGGHGAKGLHFPQDFDVISIACLDDMPDDVKAGLAVEYQDGLHDDWSHPPAATATL